jgi:hypothetical protein
MAKLNQAQLMEIFEALRQEVAPYIKGNIVARINIEGKLDLWTEKKNLQVLDKTRDEMAFTTIIVQSTYVGFYFMPIYCLPEQISSKIGPELMKQLKGKAFFHIKTSDPTIMAQVRAALALGYAGYEKQGWV